jgi:hypothetical protein
MRHNAQALSDRKSTLIAARTFSIDWWAIHFSDEAANWAASRRPDGELPGRWDAERGDLSGHDSVTR